MKEGHQAGLLAPAETLSIQEVLNSLISNKRTWIVTVVSNSYENDQLILTRENLDEAFRNTVNKNEIWIEWISILDRLKTELEIYVKTNKWLIFCEELEQNLWLFFHSLHDYEQNQIGFALADIRQELGWFSKNEESFLLR